MRSRRSLAIAIAASVLLIGAVAGGIAWLKGGPSAQSPELATPLLAFAHLEKNPLLRQKPLFFTPPAAEFLKPRWQEWNLPGSGPEEWVAEFDLASHDPKAWRALDRKQRFSALLLLGDPASFRPLLDHLRKSPDWSLTYLDATSLVFERSPATEWSPKQIKKLKAEFKDHPADEQVMMRVQIAHRLAAIDELGAAKELLDEAIEADADSSPAWTQLASLQAIQGRWEQALDAARKAVEADDDYAPALAAKANALFAFGKFNEALAITRRLAADAPGDGPTLYLHAKVTHAAHAYTEEIEVLGQIIRISQSRGLPTGSWRVYLAQAYAATGDGKAALEQFDAALKEPNLTEHERDFAQKGADRIRSRQTIF